ncbi:S8 family serine peptidase [Streptomyces marokkonensis]|uniref:S8 family serine peptidase n=1 Tax=Streptomyces marokkonensis TaxID=324855 RepID=A0ABW6QG93_9ACTN
MGKPLKRLSTPLALGAVLTTSAALLVSAPPPSHAGSYDQGSHILTLITGDRVVLGHDRQPLSVERAEGREHIPMQIERTKDGTYVVPLDVRSLIDSDRLDRRLFDVTLLSRPEYTERQRDGLDLIVTYEGERPAARTALRDSGGPEVTRSFTSLSADVVTVPPREAGVGWRALTGRTARDANGLAPGIRKIWLDGLSKATLDRSVPQIGAPSAWKAGYDGTGVKIAVLDTGVDTTHPDLAAQVVAERNFSDSPDLKDRQGHGTHVASIAAGTGARSKGTHKGVAPGARILAGKVLNDEGTGQESWVISGMEWAVQQGADVVNLSLGAEDAPGLDPMEEAVNHLSATSDALFVIAAGNSGRSGGKTVATPGSADTALTVGAVTKDDRLAPFSGTGPRVGDDGLKPDITAPGVAIVAAAAAGSEAGEGGTDGYVPLDGTSMAAPHVAGAAALLKQQYPRWSGKLLKGALTGTAVPAPGYSTFEQGTGRADLSNALEVSYISESGGISFGTQQWPHHDDRQVTKEITYRNTGTQPVNLTLTTAGTGPDGTPAPAGETRTVSVTADARLGTADGTYSGAVTAASGDGRSIRTAFALVREVESYDLTIRHVGPDGAPAAGFGSTLHDHDTGPGGTGRHYFSRDSTGTDDGVRTIRLPKGRYFLDATLSDDPEMSDSGTLYQVIGPALDLSRDAEVTADARTTKPVRVSMDDIPQQVAQLLTRVERDNEALVWSLLSTDSFDRVRTAHIGPRVEDGKLLQTVDSTFQSPRAGAAPYRLSEVTERPTALTGFTLHTTSRDYAELSLRRGRQTHGGAKLKARNYAEAEGGELSGSPQRLDELPATGKLFVLASTGTKWSARSASETVPEDIYVDDFNTDYKAYAPGSAHTVRIGNPVFGPALPTGTGIFRKGNELTPLLPLFADGNGNHAIYTTYDTARYTLHRDGKLLGERDGLPDGWPEPFAVGPDHARYRLTASATRPAGTYLSSKVTASWTFTSAHTSERTGLPITVVRFAPALASDGTARAGTTSRVPVTTQGQGTGKHLALLKVKVSYDHGTTWSTRTVTDGKITVRNPDAGETVSFRAKAVDTRGNTVTQSITDAYKTR